MQAYVKNVSEKRPRTLRTVDSSSGLQHLKVNQFLHGMQAHKNMRHTLDKYYVSMYHYYACRYACMKAHMYVVGR